MKRKVRRIVLGTGNLITFAGAYAVQDDETLAANMAFDGWKWWPTGDKGRLVFEEII